VEPFLPDLSVAKVTYRSKELASAIAHLPPIRVWIDFFYSGGQRAAAAEGNPQIVDRVRRRICAKFRKFLQRPLHPERKVAVLEKSTGRNGNGEGHL
jgi:hypothetical protein